MSYLYEDENEKRRIPLPPFSYNAALTFKKVPNKKASYRDAKNLLFMAKNPNGKVSSRKKKKKESLLADSSENLPINKFSLSEKLAEVYLEISKKKKTRDGCFIKSNILEELVMQEDLSYFIMKVFPTKLFLYYKNPYGVKYFYHANVDEESELFDSIDREEIPDFIFDQIMLCENWVLMYDYHCFLQIQKYACEEECAQPILSEFVLLKPTTLLLLELVNKAAHESNNNNGSSHDKINYEQDDKIKHDKIKYESKILFDISGPLYLDIHPTAQELMNFLKNYQSPFGYISLKNALAKRPVVNRQPETNLCQEELLKILEETFQESSSERMDFESSEPILVYKNWKEELQSFLSRRIIGIDKDNIHMFKLTTFIELFELTTELLIGNWRSSQNKKIYLSVFWKDDMYYTCLTLKKYVFDPDMPYDFLSLIGEKEDLDRYIFKVAEGLSGRYNKDLSVCYKNMITDQSLCLFFPVPEVKVMEDKPKCDWDGIKIPDPKYDEYRDGSSKKKSSNTKYDEKSSAGCSSKQKKSPFILSDSDSDEEENGFNLVYKNLSSTSNFENSIDLLLESLPEGEQIDPYLAYTIEHSLKPKSFVVGDENIDNVFESFSRATNVQETENLKMDDSFKSTPGHASSSKDGNERLIINLDSDEDDFNMENHLTDILNSSWLEGVFSKTKTGSKGTSNLPTGEHPSTSYASKKRQQEEKEEQEEKKKETEYKENLDYYPKLNEKFEFSKEEFMKDLNHTHGKGLKWLINELLPRDEDYS